MFDYTRVFAQAYRQSQVFFAGRLRELGVSPGQFPHLLCVCDHPGGTQEELAARTRTDKSTVAKMVRQLMDAGLLMRRDNPGDKRSFLVFPTAKAVAMYPVIEEEKRKWHEALTCNLTDAERETLRILLEKLEL